MPKYRVRFTDMPLNIVEEIVRICESTNKAHSLDKLVATGIQQQLSAPEASTYDGCAGWHVICGKHFALSITYNTKWTLFFDLLEGCNKTFLVFKTQ
jgi:hypothetical protein